MKNALIIHGLQSRQEYLNIEKPSPSNSNWIPWLQKQLNSRGILTQTPEMPIPYEPDYHQWAALFERFEINAQTILIGHSLGAGFLIRWLSEHASVDVGKVALVAPWLDTEDRLQSSFFDFTLNTDFSLHCKKVTVLSSSDDMERINLTVDLCKKQLNNVDFIELENKGHFLKKHMGTDEFPELLELVTSNQ